MQGGKVENGTFVTLQKQYLTYRAHYQGEVVSQGTFKKIRIYVYESLLEIVARMVTRQKV